MNSATSTFGNRAIDVLIMTHEQKPSFPKLQEGLDRSIRRPIGESTG